ncbi:ribonuclease P protein component [Paralimibaculum aggregatum]|uniref:Ribonuclease P protein component n=1 Tax=Paralimibaculum aggregatum TaxID=3036245 RepID=A0ABQ6LNB2_9RHOB|nr:ribonuclease P protein component [Limibaculum sp. NKW23]GMG83197.1 ribonuclease P protein component [Limibaculum sp. NKW23]
MTAPGTQETGSAPPPEGRAPVPGSASGIETLKLRRDFLACARARKWVAPGLILQARQRGPDAAGAPRLGFTCSKKIGNAVTRSRAKRRLREAARAALVPAARDGWDYVLIGRPGATVARPWTVLVEDVAVALEKVHRPPKPRPAARPGKGAS